jgi:hypothetical protein
MLYFFEKVFHFSFVPTNWSNSFGDKGKKAFTKSEILFLLSISPTTLSEPNGKEYFDLFRKFIFVNMNLLYAFFSLVRLTEESSINSNSNITSTINNNCNPEFATNFISPRKVIFRNSRKKDIKSDFKTEKSIIESVLKEFRASIHTTIINLTVNDPHNLINYPCNLYKTLPLIKPKFSSPEEDPKENK